MTYIKPEQYYLELYDRFTIEKCLHWENKADDKDLPSLQDENPEVAEAKRSVLKNNVIPVTLYFMKGERYTKKTETVREWMARDRAKDARVADAREPSGIRCLECSRSMSSYSRHLMTDERDRDRVLFLFECVAHEHRGRAYWEGGEERFPRPYPCVQCRADMASSHERKEHVIITTYACPKCGHTETDTLDLSKKSEEEVDPDFEANRKKYCLSEKEGGEYMTWIANFNSLTEHIKDRENNKEAQEKLGRLKKLTLVQLENLLAPVCEKNGYIKLELATPEMGRDVVVGLTVREGKSDREESDSRSQLKKLIQDTLIDTNWRLTRDGINYRLGILQGRIRAYEREDDLLKLVSD